MSHEPSVKVIGLINTKNYVHVLNSTSTRRRNNSYDVIELFSYLCNYCLVFNLSN